MILNKTRKAMLAAVVGIVSCASVLLVPSSSAGARPFHGGPGRYGGPGILRMYDGYGMRYPGATMVVVPVTTRTVITEAII